VPGDRLGEGKSELNDRETYPIREICTADAPTPGGAYSQGIVVNGLVFVAGCGPQDAKSGQVVGRTISEQTRQVLQNISAILATEGSTLRDVVKVATHLADAARDFAEYDAVCREVFSVPYPARTTVGSHLPGILVEIDVIAVARTGLAAEPSWYEPSAPLSQGVFSVPSRYLTGTAGHDSSAVEVVGRGGSAADALTSALAADALDSLGYRRQCLGADIQPLALYQRAVGRAFPVRSVPALEENPLNPYEGLLAALDALPVGAVFVFATGRSDAAGIWGELITTACTARGVAGAVTDGLIRDVTRVLAADFPIFSRGATPYDSKGRVDVVEHGQPVELDGVRIASDDLIVADADGVVVVPAECETRVMRLVAEKAAGEGEFRRAVRDGVAVSEAFRRFGTL
jgi:reactive intermediate/imine deaminase